MGVMATLPIANIPEPMTREGWLRERAKGIGSSESAGVLGCSRWSNPLEVWARKLGRIPERPETDAMRLGRRFEPIIAEEFADRHRDIEVLNPGLVSIPSLDFDFVRSSPDRLLARKGEDAVSAVLEIKRSSGRAYDWDAPDPPLDYLCQTQHQMYALGLGRAWLAVLVDSTEWREFEIDRSEEFVAVMLDEYRSFWRCVVDEREPDVEASPLVAQTLRRLHPLDNGLEIELPERMARVANELEEVEGELKRLADIKDELRAKLELAIGPNSVGVLPDGRRWSFRHQSRKGYTVAESTFRSLRKIKGRE